MIMKRVGARFRNKAVALNWAEWVHNYKAGMLEMWQTRAETCQAQKAALEEELAKERTTLKETDEALGMSREHRQKVAVTMWSRDLNASFLFLQRRFFMEWNKYVATRRRGLLRRRLLLRQHAAGAHLILVLVKNSEKKLQQVYVLMWKFYIASKISRSLNETQAEQRVNSALTACQRRAASCAAACLVIHGNNEILRMRRAHYFIGWANRQGPEKPMEEEEASKKVNEFPCRHHSFIDSSGTTQSGCLGLAILGKDDQTAQRYVVCEACRKWCGCGRSACGQCEEAQGQSYRVLNGEPQVDRRWCREQRKQQREEAEESDDDET